MDAPNQGNRAGPRVDACLSKKSDPLYRIALGGEFLSRPGLFFSLSSLLLLSFGARAADLSATAATDGWLVTVGLGPQIFTSFPGASSYTVWPLPYVAWRRPNE